MFVLTIMEVKQFPNDTCCVTCELSCGWNSAIFMIQLKKDAIKTKETYSFQF